MDVNLLALILSLVLPFIVGTWLFLRSGRPIIFALNRGLWMALFALIPLLAFAIIAGGTKQFTGFNIIPAAPIAVLLFFVLLSHLRPQKPPQEQIAEIVSYNQGASSQLKLASGERILISCAQTGIKIFKLAFGGLIPIRTIAEWPITQLDSVIEIFADESAPTQHPLDAIKNKLLNCQSIGDIERLCVRQDSARPAQTPSSAGSPQMPDPARPFDSALRDLGSRLRADSGFGPCENLADAAAIALTEITNSTLTHAGSDHLLHPMASTVANASMGACFMAACLTGISVRLKELGLELDAQDIFARAGFAVFQMYPQQEQAQIISAGGNIFKKLVGESSSRENLRQWIEGVQTFTASYVLTGDKAWIPQLAKLYSTLASARE